ncbi:unnamed protein product, partial [Ixodes persulcatus]
LRSYLKDVSIKQRKLREESRGFGIQKYLSSNVDVQSYTGLPSYAHLQERLKFVEPGNKGENIIYWKSTATSEDERRGRPQKLSIEDQLFLALVKLRVGLFHKHLGHLFNVSETTVSRVCLTWMSFLYLCLTELPLRLPRDVVDTLMPATFKEKYRSTRVIIDATELRCEISNS